MLKQITTQYSAYFSDQKEVEIGGKLIFWDSSELGEGEGGGGKKFNGGRLERMYRDTELGSEENKGEGGRVAAR